MRVVRFSWGPNALDYRTGENAQTSEATGKADDTSPPWASTLNIEGLLNAQVLGGSPVTAPAIPPDEKKPPDETKTDKDGGGR